MRLVGAQVGRLIRNTEPALLIDRQLAGRLAICDIPNLEQFTLRCSWPSPIANRNGIGLRTKQALDQKHLRVGEGPRLKKPLRAWCVRRAASSLISLSILHLIQQNIPYERSVRLLISYLTLMTANNPFQRYDETDDRQFYGQPRLVNHIDEAAVRATTNLYAQYLPAGGNILDLMSSWVSHLPTTIPYGRVAGLGMNEVELKANPQLTDYVVQNLNQTPSLGYGDNTFDGGMVTVSVQYLTQPVRVYRELARVLRPGSPFLTVFSNRMFPTKAVAIWQSLDDQGHQQLVRSYYEQTGLFDQLEVLDHSPRGGSDPLFAVVGRVKKETGSTDDSSGIRLINR